MLSAVTNCAFLACDRIIWYDTEIDNPLDIMPGYGIGPLEEIVTPGESGWTDVFVEDSHPASGGVSGSVAAYYFDGPKLDIPGGHVYMWYEKLDAPAAVTISFGSGQVEPGIIHQI